MGLLISFSGVDGAGKSTQIRRVSKYLRGQKKKVFVTEMMFGYSFLKPLVKFLRSATKSSDGGPVRRNVNNRLYELWFVLAFVDIWYSYLFRVKPLVEKNDFVVADRFYTDIWANLLFYGYIPQWAFVFFIKLLPRSEKAFILLESPEVGQKRSSEFPLSYYRQQSAIYSKLAGLTKCFVIDANKDPKAVFGQIRSYL